MEFATVMVKRMVSPTRADAWLGRFAKPGVTFSAVLVVVMSPPGRGSTSSGTMMRS